MTALRYADERKLAQDLQNGLLKPVYLLTGGEGYLKTLYRERLLRAALGGEPSGVNLALFSGARADLDEIYGAVSTPALSGGRRCVLVDEFLPDKATADADSWAEILGSAGADALLLLVQSAAPDADKKKPSEAFFALVDAAGGAVVTLDARRGGDLAAFAVRRCGAAGAELPPAAARSLTERTGEDMARLASECDKLSAYAGPGGVITEAMMDSLTPATVEADVFKLSRHLLAGEPDRALRLLDALFALRTPAQLITATLSGAFADLLRARVGYEKGRSQADIAADFAYRHAFRVKNALRDSRPLSRGALEAAAAAILEADLAMKSGAQDERVTLERALVRAAAALRGEVWP